MVHLFNCVGWLPNNYPGATLAHLWWVYGADWMECRTPSCQGFGLAKSFTKNLDKDTLIDHDEDAVAALFIFWALVQVYMPSKVVSHVEECLEKEGLPHLATRNVDQGCTPAFILLYFC